MVLTAITLETPSLQQRLCSSQSDVHRMPQKGKGNREAVEELKARLHSKAVLRPHSLHGQKESPFLSSAS